MTKSGRVVVAMSGGVDSSVAAALLKQQGYDVIGMMLRLWSEPGKENSNRCCTPDSMATARRVAARLEIPFYAVDAQDEFNNSVVQYFIDGYTHGITPNPCLVCNRQIRFGFLLDRAIALGADYLATGHYAKLSTDKDGDIQLLRAIDANKDQSYILHVLNQFQLNRTLFPLGEYQKNDVREIARGFDIQIADRPDSQDLCFLAGDDYRKFLTRNVPSSIAPGPIMNHNREVIGKHQGVAFYTIGQRKGLGLSSSSPLYVIEKEFDTNALIVGSALELGRRELLATEINWIKGHKPGERFRAQVKIRYKAREAWGTVHTEGDQNAKIIFDEPLKDITPGQAAVIYNDNVCLGGGIIALESEQYT